MTISYKLAPTFYHAFRRIDGLPLTTNGKLYSYKDTDHNTHKPIYQDPLGVNPYSQPIDIPADGVLGLLYFADDEQYYLELYDGEKGSGGTLIASYDHYPDEVATPEITERGERNYILNPEFLKLNEDKLSFATTDLPANVNTWIAYEGWIYSRNNTNATNTIAFKEFTPGQTNVPGNPKYYLEFDCSGFGAGGENESDSLMVLPNVAQFSGEETSFAVWIESSTSSTVQFVVKQNFGTGGDVDNTKLHNITTNASFAQYKFEGITIDSVSGKNIQDGNYIAFGLRMPLNQISNIKTTKFQINSGSELLPYDYKTYPDESILKRAYTFPDPSDAQYGLQPMWNGVAFEMDSRDIGTFNFDFSEELEGHLLADGTTYSTLDTISETGDRVSYARLFDAWDARITSGVSGWYTDYNGNAFGYGDDGFFPTAIASSQLTIVNTKSETDVTLWNDHNTGFIFTKTRTGQDYGFNTWDSPGFTVDTGEYARAANNWEVQFECKNIGGVTDATTGDLGALGITVTIITQGDGSNREKFIVAFAPSSAAVMAGKHWTCDSTTGSYYVWYVVDGVGTDPAIGGRQGIRVDLNSTYMDGSAIAEVSRFSLDGTTQHLVQTVAASTLSGGEYYHFYNSVTHYVGYITIDGIGVDPKIASTTSIPIPLSSSDDADMVREKFCKRVARIFFQVPDLRGWGIRGASLASVRDPDRLNRYIRGDFANNLKAGSRQLDSFREHSHLFGSDTYTFGAHEAWHDGTNHHCQSTGENETRMMNMSVNFFVKY